MSVQNFNRSIQRDRFMSEQQFEKVVDAILAGKYSWACVLILQAAGYNPLHYIPYRTYNRLIKDNCLNQRKNRDLRDPTHNRELSQQESSTHPQQRACKIENLSYLEETNKDELEVVGGCRILELYSTFQFVVG